MNPIAWLFGLTDHQLNALGTFFAIIASIATVINILGVRWARLAFKNARDAKEQTRRTETIDGKEYSVSVSQDAHHASNVTSDLRAELSPLRPHGRRRNTPTNPVRLERDMQ